MSSESQPISPARFAAALADLSLASLHGKAAELRNNIAHLKSSNEQLQEFKEDRDCAEAVVENELVITRMTERIALLKAEVENRGMPWVEERTEVKTSGANGDSSVQNGAREDGQAGDSSNIEDGVHL